MGLFDRQSRHCKILVDGRNHRRRCGRHSCRALFSADGSGIAKEAATHAKAIIKRRLSLGLVPPSRGCQLQHQPIHHRGAMFSADVSTTPSRIVPRQEIRPAIISSPNASTVTQLFQLFTSEEVAARTRARVPWIRDLGSALFFTEEKGFETIGKDRARLSFEEEREDRTKDR